MFDNRFCFDCKHIFISKEMIKQFDNVLKQFSNGTALISKRWLSQKTTHTHPIQPIVDYWVKYIYNLEFIASFRSDSKISKCSWHKATTPNALALYIACTFVWNAFNMLIRIHVCHSLDGSIVISKKTNHLRRQTIDGREKEVEATLSISSLCPCVGTFLVIFFVSSNHFSLSLHSPKSKSVDIYLSFRVKIFFSSNVLFERKWNVVFVFVHRFGLFVYSV